jgi:hypothetical protein
MDSLGASISATSPMIQPAMMSPAAIDTSTLAW